MPSDVPPHREEGLRGHADLHLVEFAPLARLARGADGPTARPSANSFRKAHPPLRPALLRPTAPPLPPRPLAVMTAPSPQQYYLYHSRLCLRSRHIWSHVHIDSVL